ncbi:hypothetical protein Ahy_A07g032572 [Arachis hypogaea]|uniref:Protein FAR1-RELATED SEQUENCE n=1 Tax=Arachis hypogaea TaxID=3818 RepID=A0A445C7B2_ARAHY|nr:hypothetical protein Ahy_A07g032572 [Arachis hypogaea]
MLLEVIYPGKNLEQINGGDAFEYAIFREEDSDPHEYFGDNFYDNWEERGVDGVAELGYINFKQITASENMMFHFLDRSVAFSFYNLYTEMNGFAVKKNKIRRNAFKDIGSDNDGQQHKCEPKPKIRCGCEAEIRVHVHGEVEAHNHEILDDRLTYMLSGHRKMNASIIDQMNMMLKV